MPAEYLRVVEEIYSGTVQRDPSLIPKYFAPEVEVHQSEALPWGGDYRGYEGLGQFLQRLQQNVDSRVETERLIDVLDTVVQVGRTRGTVRATGQAFDIPEVHIW